MQLQNEFKFITHVKNVEKEVGIAKTIRFVLHLAGCRFFIMLLPSFRLGRDVYVFLLLPFFSHSGKRHSKAPKIKACKLRILRFELMFEFCCVMGDSSTMRDSHYHILDGRRKRCI